MKQTKVYLQNQHNQRLVGLRALPDLPPPTNGYPVVVLVHGFGAAKEEYGLFEGLASGLNNVGLAVYRFDFTGSGESEGDYNLVTLTQLVNDLRRIIEFVKLDEEIDATKIGLCGQSLGGPTTIALSPQVQALVFLGVFEDVYGLVSNLFKDSNGFNPEGQSRRVMDKGEVIILQPQFWLDLKSNHTDLLRKASAITAPTLFVWGTNDDKVRRTQVQALFNVKEIGQKKLLIIPGADHGYEPARERMYKPVVKWFQKYLTPEAV